MQDRERVIILGGGIGAMAAAWGITSVPGWERRYEITVHQMGWRLGGKGASGRNAAANQRIEEHGLHIWSGFYENAFRLMREVYAELDRPADAPLATWEQAFKPRRTIQMQERVNGRWVTWPVHFPDRGGTPGDGVPTPTPFAFVQHAITLQLNVLREAGLPPNELGNLPAVLRSLRRVLQLFGAHGLLSLAGRTAALGSLGRARRALARRRDRWVDGDDAGRRLYMLIDLGLAIVRGMLVDGVLQHGFDAIDDHDLAAWLLRHGASETSVGSVTVRAFYDYVFAYTGGRTELPRLAAGTSILGVLRLMFCYQGAFFYEMDGGMGDVVFGPLYEVLKRRGVRFEFFHRVEALEPGPDGTTVDTVRFTRQAELAGTSYAPLVDVDGVPCWPSEPRWEQLAAGTPRADFESRWDPTPGTPFTLRRGEDFDTVVLGISVAEHATVCAGLMAVAPRYRRMVNGLHTVRTRSAQLWFRDDPATAGAPDPAVISTGYARPFDTWADMSFLLPTEHWGEDAKFLVYLCGALDEPDVSPIDPEFPAREEARVRADLDGWLGTQAGWLWPGLADRDDPRGVPRSALADGPSVYVRANVNPSDRYVAAAPGTTRLRLEAGDSGFSNLALAGDWVYTSLSAGCIESATMGGLHAAEAVTGADLDIIGRYTFRWGGPPADTSTRVPA